MGYTLLAMMQVGLVLSVTALTLIFHTIDTRLTCVVVRSTRR